MSNRIVATLTTLPDRYNLLSQTIDSLVNQSIKFDNIYISLPERTRRFNTVYPPLPSSIIKHEAVIPVAIESDYGPITKLLGALKRESDSNTIIISVDDDIIYPYDFVEKYLALHKKYPHEVICGGGLLYNKSILYSSVVHNNDNITTLNGLLGFNIPSEGRNIDIVFGIGGVVYKRGFFPSYDKLYDNLLQYALNDNNTFLNDDVMISGYLSKMNIKRRIFANAPYIKNLANDGPRLSANVFKMAQTMNNSISYLTSQGFFPDLSQHNENESAVKKLIVLGILLVLFIILLIYFIYFINKNT
jgi:hypothetical protein